MQGPGIGVPFNVHHVAHIGADNVEALLIAAKDDPKLLPSFLLPEGLADDKENRKKSVQTENTKAGELISELLVHNFIQQQCIVKLYCCKPLSRMFVEAALSSVTCMDVAKVA